MRLLKGNKWQQWWDSLPENYKTYLENQGQHYEQTDYLSIAVSFLLGALLGLSAGWYLVKHF